MKAMNLSNPGKGVGGREPEPGPGPWFLFPISPDL